MTHTPSTTSMLRAHVYQDRRTRLWYIEIDDPLASVPSTWSAIERSHPEAMQRAYVMLRDLDQQLMDDVHASRASRRAAKTVQRCFVCDRVVADGEAHLVPPPGFKCRTVFDREALGPHLRTDTYLTEAPDEPVATTHRNGIGFMPSDRARHRRSRRRDVQKG